MPGGWGWRVDLGVTAVLLARGRLRGGARDDPATLVGQDVDCVVVEVDTERERMVVAVPGAQPETDITDDSGTDDSRVEEADDRRREEIARRLRPGDALSGHVHGLVPFGAFVDVGGVHGLVHVSELGQGVDHPEDVLRVGQRVEASVIDTHVEMRRVSLRLTSVLD